MKKIAILIAMLALGVVSLRAEDKLTLAQARAEFAKADAELNKVYKVVIAELDKANAAKLREDERDWIDYREQMAKTNAFNADDTFSQTPKSNADYWESMAEYTQERTKFLRMWSGKNAPRGITGEYSDSYDGTLDLEETKDGIEFSLSVVRTRAHNEGSIDGTLHPKDGKAYFKQKLGKDEDFGPPCELVFTFTEGHIVKIEELTADSLAGHNVHYSGDYYKIGKLKPAEKESK